MLITEKPPKQKNGGKKTTSLLIAIAVHVFIGLIAAIIAVMPPLKDEPEIVAQVIGPVSNQKMQIQRKQVQKQADQASSSSAASAIAQMMRSNAVARIAAPKVTNISKGPLGLGEGDLGSGFGTGTGGGGMGSGASFFGGTATGNRFLFVIDHSLSMRSHQVKLRNTELEKTLKSLKGAQYHVLLFAGPAFFAEKGWSSSRTVVKDPKGKSYQFRSVRGAGDYEFVGPDSKLPKAKWLSASSSNVKKTMEYIRGSKLVYGTDWELALRIGHHMDPRPDVIFFMADGTGGNSPPPILKVNAKFGRPKINTVAMQTTAGSQQFAEVAKKTGGTYTIVDKSGKPINGFDYLKNPGKFRGRL